MKIKPAHLLIVPLTVLLFSTLFCASTDDRYTCTIIESKVLCKQPGRYVGWPSIAIAPNGDLMAVFSGSRAGHVSNDGRIQMVRSGDGGSTWSEEVTVFDTPIDDRDAGNICTLQNTIIVSWFTGPYGGKWQGNWINRKKMMRNPALWGLTGRYPIKRIMKKEYSQPSQVLLSVFLEF